MRTGISITLKAADRRRLTVLVRDRNAPHKHVWRPEIVLLSATVLAPMKSCAGPANRRPACGAGRSASCRKGMPHVWVGNGSAQSADHPAEFSKHAVAELGDLTAYSAQLLHHGLTLRHHRNSAPARVSYVGGHPVSLWRPLALDRLVVPHSRFRRTGSAGRGRVEILGQKSASSALDVELLFLVGARCRRPADAETAPARPEAHAD